jgi:hypothetical protein
LTVALFWVILAMILVATLLRIAARASVRRTLRPLPGVQALPALLRRAAETGYPVHASAGVGGVGGATTAETWAGLALLSHLADQAALYGVDLVVTVADATILSIAQDILQQAYERHGLGHRYEPGQVQFVAPQALAYAAGTMGSMQREPLAGSVLVGAFGDEYLLLAETGARQGIPQVAGASDPRTLPLLYATADQVLAGEEIFAAGASASRQPALIGTLVAEDWARWLLILALVVATISKLLT